MTTTELKKAVKAFEKHIDAIYKNTEAKKMDDQVTETAINVALEPLNNVLQQILSSVCSEILKMSCHKVEENGSIIHYTSINAVFSMLESAIENMEEPQEKEEPQESKKKLMPSLRLYDSVHFNDPEEGKFLISNLSKDYEWLKNNAPSNAYAYIASFISGDKGQKEHAEDDLVFWRTYGKEGEGCSLSLTGIGSHVCRVAYGGAGAKATIKKLAPALKLLSSIIQTKAISTSKHRKYIEESIAKTIWRSIERIRYLYKSDAYKYENECRFIRTKSDIDKDKNKKIRYECLDDNRSSVRIRHYYEDEKLSIKNILSSRSSIMLGPRVPYRNNVRDCIEKLKKEIKLHCEVKVSNIQYRKS